jgi:GDPmannose 4,6-dehydratase
MDRIAVIVGCGGQDGRLLEARLRELCYSVVAIRRGTIDITNPDDVRQLLATSKPAEVYFLAAHHHSSQQLPDDAQGELFRQSNAVHFVAAVNFLDAIATVSMQTRMFYASSSLIYTPSVQADLQSEATTPNPEGAYAITKLAGMMACQHYRRSKGVFASIGIMFNHESKFRGEQFLSRKIVRTAVRIKLGLPDTLELGDLNVQVDWGYAPDYVDAMQRILQLDKPDDFIVATGHLHTVREFADYAFCCLGLDYRNHLSANSAKLNRVNSARRGDSTKLRSMCQWSPTRNFKTMVKELVRDELVAMTGGSSG